MKHWLATHSQQHLQMHLMALMALSASLGASESVEEAQTTLESIERQLGLLGAAAATQRDLWEEAAADEAA